MLPLSTPGRSVRGLLLDALAVLLALSIIELPALLKVIDYRTVIGPDMPDKDWRPDPELIQIHPPYWHVAGSVRGGELTGMAAIPDSDLTTYHWNATYDRNGFRNETDLSGAETAVIGDSFVENMRIATPQLMSSVLGNLQGTVAANLGQNGYGPSEELIVLRRYALPLKPKTVVWLFNEGSDLFDVTRYRRFIQYRAKHQPHPVTDGFWRGAWNRSFTSTAIHKIRKLHRSVKLPGIRITGAVRLPGGQTVNEYFGHPASPLSADELDALREAARTFAAGFQLCSSRGARLLVVFVPEKFRVLQSFCRFPEQSLCRNWVVNDLPGRLRESMKAAAPQIEYLDLTPVLMEAVRRGTIPYENDDSHWNADGERIAAEAVHRYLSANQLID